MAGAFSTVPFTAAGTVVVNGNVVASEPTGATAGDLLIYFITYRDSATFTFDPAWTVVYQDPGNLTDTPGIAIAYMKRGASAPNYTVTRTGGATAIGKVWAWRPTAGNAVLDTFSQNFVTPASTTMTAPSITTALANELLVAVSNSWTSGTTISAFQATDPATASGATDTTNAPTAGQWRERYENTNTAEMAIADAIKSTAGATGTVQATFSTSQKGRLLVMAFKLT
jgi:hypothetical protein